MFSAVPLTLVLAVAAVQEPYAIAVEVASDTVTVTATARGDAVADTARVMLRDGQTVDWDTAVAEVDTTAGVMRVSWRGGAVLRYVVVGRLERIPLPVLTRPMPQAERSVRLVVRGLDAGVPVTRAFPRLQWEGRDAVTALRDVPTVLRLPVTGIWDVGWWSEFLVLLLVGGSSSAWWARRRARGAAK